jgi:DNA-directed RNA polymerase beta' subunit
VWQIVREETRAYTEEEIQEQAKKDPIEADRMRKTWYLIFNIYRMKNTGIESGNVVKLIEACGLELLEETGTHLLIRMPFVPDVMLAEENKKPAKERRNLEQPGEFVGALISQHEKEALLAEETAKRNGNILYQHPPTEILRNGYYFYAETDGANLRGLLAHDLVDPVHTITNNVFEIYGTLGIEATRNFLISELIEVISADGSIYIDPRHIILLVEFMTNQGIPLPVTYMGISRQQPGFITKTTFERATDEVLTAALYGDLERNRGASFGVMTGQRGKFGTGLVEVRPSAQLEREMKAYQERLAVQKEDIDGEDISDAIEDLDNADYGTQILAETDNEAIYQEMLTRRAPVKPAQSVKFMEGNPSAKTEIAANVKPPLVVSNILKEAAKNIPRIPIYPAPSTTIQEGVIGMNPALASMLQARANDTKQLKATQTSEEEVLPQIEENIFVEEQS